MDVQKKSEKLQVLTILPKSWSIKRIETEFGTTNHMARLAKALVARKGILATSNPRSGKTLSDDTVGSFTIICTTLDTSLPHIEVPFCIFLFL